MIVWMLDLRVVGFGGKRFGEGIFGEACIAREARAEIINYSWVVGDRIDLVLWSIALGIVPLAAMSCSCELVVQ